MEQGVMAADYVLRHASASDVDAIAALHAESWRSAYRGLVPDDFLGPGLDAERLQTWRDRFATAPAAPRLVLLALSAEGLLVGFTCVLAGGEPGFGPLLDNLHVKPAWRGRGLGGRLLHASRVWVREVAPGQPMHLWVIEGNAPARAFYGAQGGVEADRRVNDMAGTDVPALRYVWPALADPGWSEAHPR
jgi:GNAT superfamily N-acetyltransferase